MPRIHNVGGVRQLPFLYVPTVLNVVTTGNGMGTNNVLKWNRALGFEFSIQFSVYGATIAKVTLLYLDTIYCKFLLNVSIEINPFSCEQTLVQHPN